MPRYYFDIQDCIDVRDDQGVELPDMAAVRAEAHRALAELVSHQSPQRSAVQIRADVRDGDGERVLTATLLIVSEAASEDPGSAIEH
ncbi:DUF6894 family protein [Methylobacterium planeticum]|uniref:DUF6894 domain-containing protein n=1 Tax=Methylobacterium planeticum TaxID=2615211 RepID=A0A6N6N0P9_9HYPH|nr:hypothetical protein [Methylobacterium planeticum]KAB1076032.1 hypothetical protein F6X51_00345 [Methylobacterium planeticum]